MTCRLHGKPTIWSGGTDDDAHRTYFVTHLVHCSRKDGPANVMQTPGLPLPGAIWEFEDDLDVYAYCYPWMETEQAQVKDGDPHEWWTVKQKFSTKPMNRCQDQRIEDPLLEPAKVSGGHSRFTHEASYDRFGRAIVNSAWERYRGQDVEFDRNRPNFKIEQNVAILDEGLYVPMVDTVNDAAIWGFNSRCVKLSSAWFERNVYGRCNFYFTRHFEFEVNHAGFDRYLPDEGTKVLAGHWDTHVNTSNGIGSGCRVWIRASLTGGALTYVELAKDPANPSQRLRGYSYPASTDVKLRLVGGGGAGGIIYATTDANGRIDTVRIENSGDAGYPFGLGSGYSSSPAVNPLYFGAGPGGGQILKGSVATAQIADSCAVNVSTQSGTINVPSPITNVVLVNGGKGYPGSSTIRLGVVSDTGSGAVLKAITNSSGVVTSVTVEQGGADYTPDSAAETTFSCAVWVPDLINGQLPDKNNPTHFRKYIDPAGQPSKVVLDGNGVPARSPLLYNNGIRISGDPAARKVEYYPESNFLLLGLPLDFQQS